MAQDEVFQAIWCRCQWLLDPPSAHAESWQRLRIEGLRFEDPWFGSVIQTKMCKSFSTIILCMSPLMRKLFSSQQLKSTRIHVLQSWYILRISPCRLPIVSRSLEKRLQDYGNFKCCGSLLHQGELCGQGEMEMLACAKLQPPVRLCTCQNLHLTLRLEHFASL